MTEPHLRDTYAYLDTLRATLMRMAVELAEMADWARHIDLRASTSWSTRIADRCDRLAFETAAAMEAMERIYPLDPFADEDTQPGVEPPLGNGGTKP